jgi:CheY-like chemotaxis protein
LKGNGYKVLASSSGPSAIDAFEQAGAVDMLLTDVVMNEMNGFELAHHLTERAPGLRVLYMSGYRENINETGAPIVLLSKPFTPDALLTKVRDVLDGKAEPA